VDKTVINTTITDQTEKYLFPNFSSGIYVVASGTIPGSLEFTQQNTPGDNGNNTNSDAGTVTGKTAIIALSNGEADLTIDAGIRPKPTATVGDYVWSDLDSDGIQDTDEPGIGGMVATLYNSLNQPIGSAITDGTGYYLISNVPPGTGYYIIFGNVPNNPGGIQPSFTLQGIPSGTNSSHADGTGTTNTFTVNAGDNITNIDAGIKDWPGRAVLAALKFDVSATLKGKSVTVNWTTTQEVKNSKFVIEKSVNNVSFSPVGEKAAAGNSTGTTQYNHLDDINSLMAYPVIYYRVKMVNLDGGSVYSKVVAVKLNGQSNLSVWPNPFSDKITLSFVSSETGTVEVRLLDHTGRTVRTGRFNVVKGNNQLYLGDLNALPKGAYLLQLEDAKGLSKYTEKILK